MTRRDPRTAFTLIESVVVIAIISALTGLTLAGVQRVRSAADRATCSNKLRQLGLGLQSYMDAYGQLPPGCSVNQGKSTEPFMTWMTRLLPFLEQEALWQQAEVAFRQESFFENPPHTVILGRHEPSFWCPSDNRGATPWSYGQFQVGFTSYQGVEGTDLDRRDGVLFLDSRVSPADITDGTSQTLLVGERPPSLRHDFGWWYAGWGQRKTGSGDSVLGVRELTRQARMPRS
jgi:prepilin-type N-terminal cleavage/methylation domain-containing protein